MASPRRGLGEAAEIVVRRAESHRVERRELVAAVGVGRGDRAAGRPFIGRATPKEGRAAAARSAAFRPLRRPNALISLANLT
jgi:hypothetical protein